MNAENAEAEIRALRMQSNAAIAAHDVAAVRAIFAAESVVLPGSNGIPAGFSTLEQRFAVTFADPEFVAYIRTPLRILVSQSGKRAAETGEWTGIWRKPDGEMRVTGIYQAMWVPTPAGWRLRNESFVTLACSGSADCSQSD